MTPDPSSCPRCSTRLVASLDPEYDAYCLLCGGIKFEKLEPLDNPYYGRPRGEAHTCVDCGKTVSNSGSKRCRSCANEAKKGDPVYSNKPTAGSRFVHARGIGAPSS